jgi:hypothetical protein
MHKVIAGCETIYFGMSVSDTIADGQYGGGGKALWREGVHHMPQMTLARETNALSAVTKIRIPITPSLGSEIENMPNGT